MKAIDTNIVVRLLLRDDEEQYAVAKQIVEQGVLIPVTVILETGWLLGSRYKFPRTDIVAVFSELLNTTGVVVENPDAIGAALGLYAAGADFADAIHLVAARGAEAFVTFDRTCPDGSVLGVPVEIVGAQGR